jgi:hypothetical protein
MKTSSILVKVGLFLILSANMGCLPPGVTWLPDSSGFVYRDDSGNGRLVHFDVAKGQKRVIVNETETGNVWPAVSPDGKHVAVARLEPKEGRVELQIIFYDITGKVTKESDRFDFSERDARFPLKTVLFWSPLDNQIIVCGCSSGVPNCGIYDVEAKRLSNVPGIPAAFGGNPIRPDGKGFLVAKGQINEVKGMAFIDRQGKEHPIAWKSARLDLVSEDKQQMLVWPVAFSSSWEGNKAVVFNAKGRFEIDTDKYVGTFIPSEAQAKIDPGVISQFSFSNSSKTVRVLRVSNQPKLKGNLRRGGTISPAVTWDYLEIFDSKEKKANLIQKAKVGIMLFPSPNRKLVAVRCDTSEAKVANQKDLILVINQQGEVVARQPDGEGIEDDHKAILAYMKSKMPTANSRTDFAWWTPASAVSVKVDSAKNVFDQFGERVTDEDGFVAEKGRLYRLQFRLGAGRIVNVTEKSKATIFSYYFLVSGGRVIRSQEANSDETLTMCKILGEPSKREPAKKAETKVVNPTID